MFPSEWTEGKNMAPKGCYVRNRDTQTRYITDHVNGFAVGTLANDCLLNKLPFLYQITLCLSHITRGYNLDLQSIFDEIHVYLLFPVVHPCSKVIGIWFAKPKDGIV